ncbi:MAG: winged helix-turn-helix domain-containing protein [Candidatus Limnocylindria bacterium]
MLELSPDQARRIAVRAQLLDGSATAVLDTIRRLGYLQLDPTNRVARSHLLVLWSRLGPYDGREIERLLWEDRALFEYRAFIYPVEALPLLRATRMGGRAPDEYAWSGSVRRWMTVNEPFRRYVLRELRRRGPLLSRDFEDRAVEAWQSTGWTGNRNVSQMLEFLWERGELAVVGRAGAQRVWDLADRWYPRTAPVPPARAHRELLAWRLRSLGIVRSGPGRAVSIRGVAGAWVADPEAMERADEPLPDRTTLLSPFDRLIHDRERAEDLFGFRYRMEIYVPKEQRQYGYFVLPVLRGDRLVGRIDPEYDRRTRILRVNAVFPEPGVSADDLGGLDGALASLATFLGAERLERAA